jgi:GNAT superfamily N-acetyltransferase
MKITYKTSLEFSNSELKKLYELISPITFQEKHLLDRKIEDLAKSIFSVYAFDAGKLIGFGFLYPSRKNRRVKRWIKWKGMKLVELGTLYVAKEYRKNNLANKPKKNDIAVKLIDLRLDFAEENNYFPVTVTKHTGMIQILEGKALRIEDVDGEYSEIKSLIRDCYCKTNKQKSVCNKCPYDERIVWVYLRFVLRKY